MIGPNVITLGGSWPECQTTSAKVISQKRRCNTEDDCAENQDGTEMVVVKKRRNKRTLADADNRQKVRGVAVATKNINNNLIISHEDDRVISDETVLIIDANFGCSRTSTSCSITTNTETISSMCNSMPILEVASSDAHTGSESAQTGSGNAQTGSASVHTGSASVQTPQPEAVDNPNLSWLLDFKVSSLFDPDGSEENGGRLGNEFCGGESVMNPALTSLSSSSSTFAMPSPTPVPHPSTTNRLLKPPFTYTELIEQALKEKGQLTVSGIYYWMSEKFPFFKAHDERWKNSVRHNLSINPHFRKGMKASQGSGHFWTLSTQGAPPPVNTNNNSWKITEVRSMVENQETDKSYIDEVATATASIEEPSQTRFSPPLSMTIPDSATDPSLARTAEEILSGVKKEVQVQYLSSDTDFLNQMTRNGLVEESNLTEVSTSFLMNDLGSEVILNDSFFCDDLNFQYCELTTAQM